MTQSTTKPLAFSSANRRKIDVNFEAGVVTNDAGLLLLREADRQIALIDAVDAAIFDPRSPALTVHHQRTLVAQRIFGIADGYEDLNDHDRLRHDPLWQTATDHPAVFGSATLASSPTLCRFENRIDRAANVRLAKILVEQFVASFDAPPTELVLDFDATDDLVHGQQENHFFHGYYRHDCFLPLYATCGSRLLVAYLRPARFGADHHAQAIVKSLVTRLRQSWPNVNIVIRGDGGFCRWKIMRWCDSNDVRYIFGWPRNAVLQSESTEWLEQVREANRLDGQSHRVFGTLSCAAKSWDRARRVIAKAEYLRGENGASGKSNPRYVVTNMAGDPQTMCEANYCHRGDSENKIKEQQLGLFADRTSCHAFDANRFRVLLSAFAYVLVSHIRRTALVGTELEKAEVGTIRLRLFRVAGLVLQTARRLAVSLSSHYPLQDVFRRVAMQLQTRPLAESS